MSDLISRSALMACICLECRECREKYEILNWIEKQPTAFDVDKVITELEQAKDDFHGGTLQTAYYWKGIDKAIEIINKCLSDTAEPPKTD